MRRNGTRREIADRQLDGLFGVEGEPRRQLAPRRKLGKSRNRSGIAPAERDDEDEIQQAGESASGKNQRQKPERRA